MKISWVIAVAGVVGVSVIGVLWWQSAEESPPQATPKVAASRPLEQGPQTLTPVLPVKPPVAAVPVSALPPIDQSRPAEISMNEARLHGDARTPPIVRSPEAQELPTPEELKDPALYKKYEQRQALHLYANYVKAADDKIPELQQQLQLAKDQGIPAEKLAVGEEKLRRIQAMRDELLSQHPELQH